ncbi:MAG: class I SAM-dependent methyltransferase [Anaerolineae bacterium]|nr:MAG: class I SAM-dependent methyltransferase [Anaerolineae bacterium]
MRRFMRFFFYHFYHSLAWTYDLVATTVSLGRWTTWGRAALPFLHGKRVLELGFGPGHLQVEMHRAGWQVFGVDESRQMIGQARRHLLRNALPVNLSRGLAQFLPFASATFDSVVATFPSEYITDPRTLSEIRRVLKAQGHLVIVPVAWLGGKSMIERGAQWLFRITGQGPEGVEERIIAFLAQHDFHAACSKVEIRHSTVLVVVAEKK